VRSAQSQNCLPSVVTVRLYTDLLGDINALSLAVSDPAGLLNLPLALPSAPGPSSVMKTRLFPGCQPIALAHSIGSRNVNLQNKCAGLWGRSDRHIGRMSGETHPSAGQEGYLSLRDYRNATDVLAERQLYMPISWYRAVRRLAWRYIAR
jgi:hypothetical protein